MNFDMNTPVRLITGRGCVKKNSAIFSQFGEKCLIMTGCNSAKKSGALSDICEALDDCAIKYIIFDQVQQNPTLTGSMEAANMAKKFGAQFVVGIGGGSPLDAAKAAAVYATNEMELTDIYHLNWKNKALPIILVGTTAGTGSEVGPVSVMTRPDGKKQSFLHAETFAALSFGDPAYTDSLPMRFTISTALDALAHALEGYFSTAANDYSDLMAREAIHLLVPELIELNKLKEGEGRPCEAMRDRLYYASVLAGLTLARCGTCYCHTLGYFLSEEYEIPHGTACAVYLSDFVRREHKLLPEKAARLFHFIETGCDELCELIDNLNEPINLTLTKEQIAAVVNRCNGNNNFLKTAPNGYTAQEATMLLTTLFKK